MTPDRGRLLSVLVPVAAVAAVALAALLQTVDDPGDRRPLPGPEVTPLPIVAPASLTPGSVRVLVAGDIGLCGSPGTAATGALLDANPAATVIALGDIAYDAGTEAQLRECYDPFWGGVKSRTWAVPGNHDEQTSAAAPYFAYFGDRAGSPEQSWRAIDIGAWRVYLLDSECASVGACRWDDQVAWLKEDLAAHPTGCVLAAWHRPRWSSGPHGSDASVDGLWRALAEDGADVAIAANDHSYERFAPLDPAGSPAPAGTGLRQFVVGTGGAQLYRIHHALPASEARTDETFGVLELILRPDGYDWAFRAALGTPFEDTGSGPC